MKKATRQDTKEHNRNLVLKTIFDHASISRAEIARVTSLTRTTVSDIVTSLLDENLVSEIGVGSSLGGKQPVLLGIEEDSRCLIGLDLARNQFRGAIVNLRGKIQQTVTLSLDSKTGDEAIALVYEILDRLVEAACLPKVGIGIGTPGLVNIREGTVVNSVNLDWKDLPLAHLMEERYHLPVYILNDSQAAAMGEFTYGKNYPSDSNLVVINARHGIGAGIIINGKLFLGDGGSAGEIGHVVVIPEGGQLCRCGNHGCLETVASTQALIKRVQAQVSPSISSQLPTSAQEINLDAIERAYLSGDRIATQAILDSGHYIGLAISSLVGTLNIQKIVLTGDMTRFGQPWMDAIRAAFTRTTLARLEQETKIEIGQLGGNDIILGASAMLASNYSLLFRAQQARG
jgi:glucokinase-like ROK family protein